MRRACRHPPGKPLAFASASAAAQVPSMQMTTVNDVLLPPEGAC
jgi:hypothetical protein